MPRLYLEQYLDKQYDHALMAELVRQLEDSINRLSEGRIYQKYNASIAAPSGDSVAYQVGDKVENINPVELGTAGSAYIITGWICISAGAPGVWREMRVLTGN